MCLRFMMFPSLAQIVRMLLFLYNFSLFLIDCVHLFWSAMVLTLESCFRLVFKPPKKDIQDQIVLVTGAGHGLGRELALEFSRKGAKVVIWDINKDGLAETVEKIEKINGKVFSYHCDVSVHDDVMKAAQRVREDVGHVDILVNNAGIMPAKPFLSMNHQQIRRVMEVNVMAYFWTISEFLPQMLETGEGHILAIASIAGKLVTANLVPYCSSKFAITGLMDALHEELRYTYNYPNLHLTTVFPFVVNTGLAKNPRIKYPWLSPITEPDVAAQKIVEGLQRNAEYIYIPSGYEYLARIFVILPRKVQHLISDFFDCGVNPHDD